MMKQLWTQLTQGILLALCLILPAAHLQASNAIDDASITARLKNMSQIISTDFSTRAKGYVKGYLYHRDDTEKLLGKTAQYFPIFEFFLDNYNLPEELKYLPIIESRLRPFVYSTAGAGGMWQFTTPTARHVGLKVNRYLDERRDPHKSTKAALKYLAYLYEQFDSWEFALAAYNCGEGRVRKAMARAGSREFKKVLPYLPKETQLYIPKFLAGQYICRYYMEHGLMPQLPTADFLHTQTVMVYKSYSMFKISNVTGVALKTLKVLNPAYYDNYIPASQTGNYLTVPQRSFALLIEYVSEREGWKPFSNHQKSGYYATKWVVGKGDTLDKLAALCGATKYQIMKWNNLRTSELYNGQILHLYYAVPSVHTPGPKA
ncbi:MAG: hypothetical protein CMN32_07670 [Saprospirales bacterium]|nr:hypothetical protein [Saprospirales bacterium]